MSQGTRFPFAFTPAYRAAALAFGVTPRRAWVELDEADLAVKFGPWSLRTPLSNVSETQMTTDYAFVKTAGPPHLSMTDQGLTFATNGDVGVCVSFHERVQGIDPTGHITHPAVTLTVADPAGLVEALA